MFVYVVGTNNVAKGRSEEIVDKCRKFVGKLKESRTRSVVCGLIPRHDVNSLILIRMLGINESVRDLYSSKGVMFVDVWDHFIHDRSLFANDGLHLNCVGKARLGRVLDEEISKELRQVQQRGEVASGSAGRKPHPDSEVRPKVYSTAQDVRSPDPQVRGTEVPVRSTATQVVGEVGEIEDSQV